MAEHFYLLGSAYQQLIPKEGEMPSPRSAQCARPSHLSEADHPANQHQREMRAFLATLNNEQRRLFAAVEANRIGQGGVSSVAAITGLCKQTIRNGRHQLVELLTEGRISKREHKPITGRPRTEQRHPAITAALEDLLSDEIAGSPEGEETMGA